MAEPKNQQPDTKIVLTKEEIEADKLSARYRDVFGDDGKRNTSQEAVWNDLLEQTYARKSIYHPNGPSAKYLSGRRDVYLHIERMLNFQLATQEQITNKRR